MVCFSWTATILRMCCLNVQKPVTSWTSVPRFPKDVQRAARREDPTAKGLRIYTYRAMLLAGSVLHFSARAQVAVGVGVAGLGRCCRAGAGRLRGPPDCSWGYYPYYPYGCAPYGYYGPQLVCWRRLHRYWSLVRMGLESSLLRSWLLWTWLLRACWLLWPRRQLRTQWICRSQRIREWRQQWP